MQKQTKIFFLFTVFIMLFSVSLHAQKKATQKKNTKKTVTKKATAKKAVTKKTVAKKTVTKKNNKSTTTTVETPKPTTTKETTTLNKKDTTQPDVVIIYAAFKPSLRNAAKLNFTAASPVVDTTKISLKYVVPAQNLLFSYQPVPLKPLALFVDSSYTWNNNMFVKLGYGGYSTPYIETGLSFGNGKEKLTSIYAMHTSSKGNLPFQQFGKTKLNIAGNYAVNAAHELYGKLYYDNNTQYQYGYQPSTLIFDKNDLKQQFNSIGLQMGYRRKIPNTYGLTYNPSLHLNYFFDAKKAGEFNVIAKVPIDKTFNENLKLNVALTADITAYKDSLKTINNNLFYLDVAAQYQINKVKLNIGLQPAFDNSEVNLLPNITAEAKLINDKFLFHAGFTGHFVKYNYLNLAAFNPYMAQPAYLVNTKVTEIYAGFKGAAGSHLTYNATVGFITMKNMPLFVNDAVTGKSFLMLNEPTLQGVKLRGEFGYNIQEKLSILAGATIYQFTKSTYEKPYGIMPVEISGSLIWKVLKDLHIKSDLFIWDGVKYLSKTNTTEKLSGAFDLNLGAEYTIMPKLNLWLQFNNLFSNKYQRWNQYEVLGLNVVGGVVYSFR